VWKEALVTQILKKGDPTKKENYRPVSCLSLNQRLFMVKRISNHISKNKVRKVVDSLWTSKLRYGLQLCSKVRLTEEQSKSLYMTMVQRLQNKMLRILDGALVLDRKSTINLLDYQNMLSINQITAQIKLT
jgi:hypothetical protein